MKTLDLHKHALRLCEFHCEIRDVREEKDDTGAVRRLVKGYASTSEVDRYEEIVDPKAFKSSIDAYMQNGIVLLDHNPSQRVGKPAAYKIDKTGLLFEAEVASGIHPLDLREQTWSEIQAGILKAYSIGFRILKVEQVADGSDDKKAGAYRRILDLELYEISLVGIPANRSTMFSVGKGLLLGSDAPVDLYKRGYWPDHMSEALHNSATGETEGGNEGVGQGEDDENDDQAVVDLQVRTAALRARG
jgi:HK97 family phage prohead protease